VSIRHAVWLNGFTALAVTKLDILDEFDEIPLCIGYMLDGEEVQDLPYTADLSRVEPIWETHPGWNRSTREARTWDELPENAKAFLTHLSKLADTPIRFVSVGPERDQLITLEA
jgi:adenylosuccinate synthase